MGGSETLQGWSDSLDKAKQNVGLLRPDKSDEEGWLKRSYGQALESAPMSAGAVGGGYGWCVWVLLLAPGLVVCWPYRRYVGHGRAVWSWHLRAAKEEIERELTATRPDLTPDEISKMAHDNAKSHAFAETGGESAGDLASWAILSKVPGGQAIFKGGKAVAGRIGQTERLQGYRAWYWQVHAVRGRLKSVRQSGKTRRTRPLALNRAQVQMRPLRLLDQRCSCRLAWVLRLVATRPTSGGYSITR